MVVLSVALLGGCETTEGEGGSNIQLFGGSQYNIFWDQGDHLKQLVEAKKFDDAAKLYAAQTEFFSDKGAKFFAPLKAAADALNKAEEAGLVAAMERVNGIVWPGPPDGWGEIRGRLAYDAPPGTPTSPEHCWRRRDSHPPPSVR